MIRRAWTALLNVDPDLFAVLSGLLLASIVCVLAVWS